MAQEDVRVLVVDDEPDACAALKALLETYGYNVETAGSAEEALIAATTHHPLCVILDLGLPRINGIELARQLRASLGTGIVLIVLTGWTRTEDHEAAEAAGVDYVLHKPIDVDRLRKLLPKIE